MRPIFADMPTSFHSLESVRYEMSWYLQSAPKRKFYMSVNRESAVLLAVPNIDTPKVSDEDLAAFKQALFKADPAALQVKTAQDIIEQRPTVLAEQLDTNNVSEKARKIDEPEQIKYVKRIDEGSGDVGDDTPLPDNVITVEQFKNVRSAPDFEPTDLQQNQVWLKHGQTGVTYDSLFGPWIAGATVITLTDAYFRTPHQRHNLHDFIKTVITATTRKEPITVNVITTKAPDEYSLAQLSHLKRIQADAKKSGVTVTFDIQDDDSELHGRIITMNNGWQIFLDKGLDIYQYSSSVDEAGKRVILPQEQRPCIRVYFIYMRE